MLFRSSPTPPPPPHAPPPPPLPPLSQLPYLGTTPTGDRLLAPPSSVADKSNLCDRSCSGWKTPHCTSGWLQRHMTAGSCGLPSFAHIRGPLPLLLSSDARISQPAVASTSLLCQTIFRLGNITPFTNLPSALSGPETARRGSALPFHWASIIICKTSCIPNFLLSSSDRSVLLSSG